MTTKNLSCALLHDDLLDTIEVSSFSLVSPSEINIVLVTFFLHF